VRSVDAILHPDITMTAAALTRLGLDSKKSTYHKSRRSKNCWRRPLAKAARPDLREAGRSADLTYFTKRHPHFG
jgi:hypothetical protein